MWVRDVRAVSFADIGVLHRAAPLESTIAALDRGFQAPGLAFPRGAFLDAWRRAVRGRDAARWSELAEEPWEVSLDALLPERIADLSDVVARAVESLAPTLEWFPDALPTLDFLHEAGYRIAVVRDSPTPVGGTWQARMAPWIDTIVSSRDVGHVKPHAAIFGEVLRRIRVPAGQVLHVGDQTVADVFGAKSVGLRTALLDRTSREPQPAESFAWLKRTHGLEPADVVPDLKVRTLEEIPAVLEQLG